MIYSAIDIGSDTIKIVVGEITDNELNILAATNTRSVGIKKGMIVDKDLVVQSINLACDELEKQLGFRIDKAIINVPFCDVSVDVYNGECYPDGEVTGSDVITCFKSSVSTIDLEREVITVFPIDFLIDEEKTVQDPKGEVARKLESRMLISTVPKQILYTYLEVLEKCNIEVIDLSFGVVNDFYNVRDSFDLSSGYGAVCDIGKDKTEIAIFNKGLMINGDTLPIGSRLIDNDISYIYHLDKSTSRELKETFAYSSSQYADNTLTLTFDTIDGEMVINQEEVSKVVEARIEEILKSVKKALNDLTKHEFSYIIIAGGVSNSPGFNYIIENTFGDISRVVDMNIIGVRNNIYTSAVGMIKYYYDKLKLRGIQYTMYSDIEKSVAEKKSVLHDKIIDDIKKYLENN